VKACPLGSSRFNGLSRWQKAVETAGSPLSYSTGLKPGVNEKAQDMPGTETSKRISLQALSLGAECG